MQSRTPSPQVSSTPTQNHLVLPARVAALAPADELCLGTYCSEASRLIHCAITCRVGKKKSFLVAGAKRARNSRDRAQQATWHKLPSAVLRAAVCLVRQILGSYKQNSILRAPHDTGSRQLTADNFLGAFWVRCQPTPRTKCTHYKRNAAPTSRYVPLVSVTSYGRQQYNKWLTINTTQRKPTHLSCPTNDRRCRLSTTTG